MGQLKINIVICIIAIMPFGCSCIKNPESKLVQVKLSYDQAYEMAKEYLIAEDYYNEENDEILYEPDNMTWISFSSNRPDLFSTYDLNNRDYYAVYCHPKGNVMGGDAFVFIDKDEKRIIGVLYGS